MATGLNKAFRLSGNSVLPAYPGFIVMKTPNLRFRGINFSPNSNFGSFCLTAL